MAGDVLEYTVAFRALPEKKAARCYCFWRAHGLYMLARPSRSFESRPRSFESHSRSFESIILPCLYRMENGVFIAAHSFLAFPQF